MKTLCRAVISLTAVLLTACSAVRPPAVAPSLTETATLMQSGSAADIAGLGACTDSPDRVMNIIADEPVVVLVHGWRGSAGSLQGLAQRLASDGRQTICFSYNDRDSLMRSSAKLAASLDRLAAHMTTPDITVIGHSQGALVARKAMIQERTDGLRGDDINLRLITVAGPFNGIAAAAHCTSPVARFFTLGLSGPICQLIAGDKWPEITFRSHFIRFPGTLHPNVREHLKIDTAEQGTCRLLNGDTCRESDFVFTLDEQRNRLIDGDRRTRVITVKAGHVEIVGTAHVAPAKLIAVLEDTRSLAPMAAKETAGRAELLATMQTGASQRGTARGSSGF